MQVHSEVTKSHHNRTASRIPGSWEFTDQRNWRILGLWEWDLGSRRVCNRQTLDLRCIWTDSQLGTSSIRPFQMHLQDSGCFSKESSGWSARYLSTIFVFGRSPYSLEIPGILVNTQKTQNLQFLEVVFSCYQSQRYSLAEVILSLKSTTLFKSSLYIYLSFHIFYILSHNQGGRDHSYQFCP